MIRPDPTPEMLADANVVLRDWRPGLDRCHADLHELALFSSHLCQTASDVWTESALAVDRAVNSGRLTVRTIPQHVLVIEVARLMATLMSEQQDRIARTWRLAWTN